MSKCAAYRKDRVNTEVHVRTGDNPEVVTDVSSGLVDLGITYGDPAQDSFEAIEIKSDTLCALVPDGHELATSTEPLSLAELDRVSMVSLPRGAYTRQLIDEAAAVRYIALSHAVIVPDFSNN